MSQNILVDTNIIINLLNEDILFKQLDQFAIIFISTITIMELYALAGINKLEEYKIKSILGQTSILSITADMAERAGRFARTRPNRNNRADLLIAATAIELNVPLLTQNTRDFRAIPDIKLCSV